MARPSQPPGPFETEQQARQLAAVREVGQADAAAAVVDELVGRERDGPPIPSGPGGRRQRTPAAPRPQILRRGNHRPGRGQEPGAVSSNYRTRAILRLPKLSERQRSFLLALETITRGEDGWRKAGLDLLACGRAIGEHGG